MKTAREVAQLVRVHYNTVINWISDNKIKAIKIGGQWRITDEEIERIYREGIEAGKI